MPCCGCTECGCRGGTEDTSGGPETSVTLGTGKEAEATGSAGTERSTPTTPPPQSEETHATAMPAAAPTEGATGACEACDEEDRPTGVAWAHGAPRRLRGALQRPPGCGQVMPEERQQAHAGQRLHDRQMEAGRALRELEHGGTSVPTWLGPEKGERRQQQLERMRMYERAAVGTADSPGAAQPEAGSPSAARAAVHWRVPPDAPVRSVRRHTRGGSSRHVAAAEASAFCLPREGSTARTPVRPRALLLFAGRARDVDLRSELRRYGIDVTTYEIAEGDAQDLGAVQLQQRLLRETMAGEYDIVFLATPCASFCDALEPQLRSMWQGQEMGMRPPPAGWERYLERANRLVVFSAALLRAASMAGAEAVLENPWREREEARRYGVADRPTIFDTESMRRARVDGAMDVIVFSQCQLGSVYRKTTALLATPAAASALHCELDAAQCNCRSHAAVAKGADEFGESLSAPAAEYPPELNRRIARAFVHVLHEQRREPVAPEGASAGLQVGSADPHMLDLDDDRVARSRRRPTFALRAHDAASAEELEARAMPVLNEAPVTSPRGAPEPQPAGAPVVRSIEDLLTLDALRQLRRWIRRTRRCIRVAERGDWSLARRLRPPDLWISADDSMRPECSAWDWDMRPLTRGEPAVPTARTCGPHARPPTSISAETLELAAREGFTDEGILSELMHGVTDDVHAPRGSFLCAPHSGALRHATQARERLQTGVTEGWACEHEEVPFWPLRCDPYSIVDESTRAGKPKFRLTNDHSWPVRPDGVISLNASMAREEWPPATLMRIAEMAESAAILEASGCPAKCGAIDGTAYYKQFGRQGLEHHRNGAFTAAGVLIDERCCFGSAADAVKCCRASNLIVWLARRRMRAVDAAFPPTDARVLAWQARRRAAAEAAGAPEEEVVSRWTCLHQVGMYVDDASHASIDDAIVHSDGTPLLRDGRAVFRAELHYEALREAFLELGIEPTKEQPPSRSVDLLGVRLDLDSARMTLQEAKRKRYREAIADALALRSISRDALLVLLGKLTFASVCYPRGRQWLHAPWRCARVRFRTSSGDVLLSRSARVGLARWAQELARADHEGVPLASASSMPHAASELVSAVYADASEEGYGAWTVVGSELIYLHGEWSPAARRLLICDLELAASTFGLVELAGRAERQFVYSFTDNTVAQSAMRTLTPSTAPMQALTEARCEWMLAHGFSEATERITSKANLWADQLSRQREAQVEADARSLGLRLRRVHVSTEWLECLERAAAAAGDAMDPSTAAPPARVHQCPRSSSDVPPVPRSHAHGPAGGGSSAR